MAEPLLLHHRTEKRLKSIFTSPPHALLVYGPAGSGKLAFAEYLAAGLLGIPAQKLTDYPYFSLLQKPDGKQEISIDAVREVTRQLNLKPVISSQKSIKRTVLIDGAHLLSIEAQNALLKALEEPPPATIFILTADSESAVLPTIASRSQKIHLPPVNLPEAIKYYGGRYEETQIESAWQLSAGAAGLLSVLLLDDAGHPLKKSVESAKKVLSMNRYERILFFDSLSSSKPDFLSLLEALSRILAALHRSAVNSENIDRAKKLSEAREMVNSASDGLRNNVSARLLGLSLALKLPV